MINRSEFKEKFPNLFSDFEPEFEIDKNIDLIFSKTSPDFYVNAYQLEQNVADTRIILDKLLNYRREMYAIESERIRTALGYINIVSIARHDRDIEIEKLSEKTPSVISAISAKCATIEKYVEDMESRHSLNGGSLNFSQRREKLFELARRDIESLKPRLEAIQKFVSSVPILGRDVKLPIPLPKERIYANFSGAGHLDDLVAWHQIISRRLESNMRRLPLHETSISLARDSIFYELGQGSNWPQAKLADIEELRRNGSVLCDLSSLEVAGRGEESLLSPFPLTGGHEYLRLHSFAISITTTLGAEDWIFDMAITQLQSPLSMADPQRIFIRATNSTHQLNWIDEDTFRNRNVKSEWLFEIKSAQSLRDPRQSNHAEWPIEDVRIHFRYSAVFDFFDTYGR